LTNNNGRGNGERPKAATQMPIPRPGGWGGPLGMPVQKPKNFKATSLRLATYFRPHTLRLLIVVVAAILSTIFSIWSPTLMGNATTVLYEGTVGRLHGLHGGVKAGLAGGGGVGAGAHSIASGVASGAGVDFAKIVQILVLLTILYILSSLFSYVQQYLMAGVAQRVVYRLRRQVNDKLTRLPLRFFDSRPHGDILSRFVNDFDNIGNTLQQSLTQIITAVITFIGVIVMMLRISLLMTLVVVLTLPLSFWVTRFIASRSQKHFKGQQKSLGLLNGHVEEMYTGHPIVKAYGHEQHAMQTFDKMNERLYVSGWRSQFISGAIFPLMNFIANLGYVLVCVIGGILVTRRAITIGDIQAFIQYTRLFSQPITQLASISNVIQSTMASAERIFELLDEREEVPEVSGQTTATATVAVAAGAGAGESAAPAAVPAPQAWTAADGSVAFAGVSFSYKEGQPLIENLNIDVQQGQTVAIVGPTGAGKTTLVNLLMRFYEIDGGEITIDGVNITQLKREHLRSLFGMVLQDTWLFNGSIRDNIGYGRVGATNEDILEAAKAAHADKFIRTLPDGYDTVLNEEASNISQGQRQLLTIARAILANPLILILDEATSSVDTRTEVFIQAAMKQLMHGRTSFVIAHRLSTIRDADLILVMNKGTIIEQGTHEILLGQRGFYADLYNSQFTLAAGPRQ